jgi:hypothetical protein
MTASECPLYIRLQGKGIEGVREKGSEKDIYALKGQVIVEWRRLHNLELYEVYSSRNIIRVTKSRRMRWAGHMACMGDVQVHTRYW